MMKKWMPLWIAGAAILAGGLGFALGSKSPSGSPQAPPGPASRAAERAGTKVLSGLAAIIDAQDETTRVGQLVGALQTGDEPALLRLLAYLSTPGVLSPQAREIYTEAVIERLLDLGGAEEIFRLRSIHGENRDALIALVVKSSARRDLDGAEKLALNQNGRDRELALQALASVLGEVDPERGLILLKDDPNGSIGYMLFSAWAAHDPAAAAQAALTAPPNPTGTNYAIGQVISIWAKADREAAWGWIGQIPTKDRSDAMNSFVSALSDSEDIASALDFVAQHPDLQHSSSIGRIGQVLGRDPEKFAALLDRFPPGYARSELVSGMADSFVGDAEAALRWADKLPPAERSVALTKLIDDFSRRDPKAALEMALGQTNETVREKGIEAAIKGWSASDFPGALLAAMDRLEGPARLSALSALFAGESYLSDLPLRDRLRLLPESLGPEVRATILQKIGIRFRSELDTALTLVDGLSGSDRMAFASGLIGWSASREQTLSLIKMIPPEERGESIMRMADQIAPTDPRTAAELAASIPDSANSPQKKQALRSIIDDWAYVDPAAARSFVATLPAGDGREESIRALAGSLLAFDLSAATQVASQATSPGVRNHLIGRLAEEWAAVDPEKGRDALRAMVRTDAEKKRAQVLLTTP